MNTSENEKEWLKRICGGQPSVEHKAAPVKEAESKPVSKKVDHGRGFKDIAGMNELKELVTEGFINVLKNPKCAEVYGLKPPSMLFYGPAGCGKTFFAEKMAEEVGINFMKMCPTTWPALGFTAPSRRLARCSGLLRRRRPRCCSSTSLTQWCRNVRAMRLTSITTAR